MKRRFMLTPLALAVLLSVGTTTADAAQARPAPAFTLESSHAPTQDGALRATLDNGLQVVILQDHLAPVVTTQITYLVGSHDAPKGFPGTAHALEHMMFRSSKGMTGDQLNEITGKMGGDNNAFTTSDATQYFFDAPAQYLDILLHIEAARMRGAELSKQGWDLERGAIEQEVSRDISSPDYLALTEAESTLFAGTGYAEDAVGTRPSFDATTPEMLRSFYDTWYVPNNAVLVIVGDVDPEATLAKVKELFGPIPKGNLPERTPLKLRPFKQRTIAKATPNSTGSVQYVFRIPGMKASDYEAVEILSDALNNPRSPLSMLVVQGKAVDTGFSTQPFSHGGLAEIEVDFPKGGDAKQARKALDNVIEDILKNGISPDLVEAAKRNERADFEYNKASASNLAAAWSQAIAWQGVDSPQKVLDKIMAVTSEDVNRVAREYLDPKKHLTMVLTPSGEGTAPPHSLGFSGSEKFAGDNKLDVPLPDWAAGPLADLQMPHWTLDPVRMTLGNGVKLVVQPEHASKTVLIYGSIEHEPTLQEPLGKEGEDSLLDTLFAYGTTTLDRNAFHKALDDIAVLRQQAGSDFYEIVPSENFDRGMELLADNELHPALPEEAFRIQQKNLAEMIAGYLETPDYKAARARFEGLFPAGDPLLRKATPETVRALTLDDLKAYYKASFRPDLTTLVVVGDVTPQQAKATVEKYFGSWKAVGPKPNVHLKPVPSNPAVYKAVNDPFASQDSVVIAQSLPVDVHNKDRYALQLANDVLGGNGFASRLMLDIRLKHGYAYGASSDLGIGAYGPERSIFRVDYGSDPDKVAAVDKLVRENLISMQSVPVSEKELNNAKQYEIRSIPMSVSSYLGIAMGLSWWEKFGEPLDQPMVAAKHYLSLNPEQVRQTFKKYIRPDDMVQIVKGPVPKKH